MSHKFEPSILREYDIRGIVGETLGAEDARAIGRSFATMLLNAGGTKIVVGYDGRISSPMLEHALVEGILASGCDVVRIGLSATPMLYYAQAVMAGVGAGIQITGSHNPPNYNGFKMVFQGRPFFGSDIQALGDLAMEGEWIDGLGTSEERLILGEYVDRILEELSDVDPEYLGSLRVGWDAGNGSAGPALERLVEKMPGKHMILFSEVDGSFPNHHPDPTVETNLKDLKNLIKDEELDFGIAFDGDGDRIGVVDGMGRIIWGDQLLMIFAADLLQRYPGATIIADVKASQALFDQIVKLGGTPLMWKTGHSLIKTKMQQMDSPLAGEMSGHIFFADTYYGFDDALYAGIRLVAAGDRLGKTITDLRGQLPDMINTPEIRFQVEEERKFQTMAEIRARVLSSYDTVNEIDGVRVTNKDGWWLLRASNTQDVLVARAESSTPEGLNRLLEQMAEQLKLSGLAVTQITG